MDLKVLMKSGNGLKNNRSLRKNALMQFKSGLTKINSIAHKSALAIDQKNIGIMRHL